MWEVFVLHPSGHRMRPPKRLPLLSTPWTVSRGSQESPRAPAVPLLIPGVLMGPLVKPRPGPKTHAVLTGLSGSH